MKKQPKLKVGDIVKDYHGNLGQVQMFELGEEGMLKVFVRWYKSNTVIWGYFNPIFEYRENWLKQIDRLCELYA